MRRRGATVLALALAFMASGGLACRAEDRTNDFAEKKTMKILIGSEMFKATLEDTPAGKGLKALMPLTLKMAELNGNEKHADLAEPLPTDARNPGAIQTGDLLLYGDRTLVLFYKSFKTSYRYTRLGHIDDPEGLVAAVGAGSVSVTYDGG